MSNSRGRDDDTNKKKVGHDQIDTLDRDLCRILTC